MARCRACDTPFNDRGFPGDGVIEDLCSHCRFVSSHPDYYSMKEYQFENITEIPVYVENYENTIDKQ